MMSRGWEPGSAGALTGGKRLASSEERATLGLAPKKLQGGGGAACDKVSVGIDCIPLC